MKLLATLFEKNGFEHKQIYRSGNIAIYRRRRPGSSNEHHEVIRVQSHNGYTIGGNFIPASETYPSSSSWGLHGFTFRGEDAAIAKAREMEQL